MLYLIGVGLNEKGISKEGLEATKKCKKVYLENYTVDFPYDVKKLELLIKKEIIPVGREKIENFSLLNKAKKSNIAILVYGNPLFATTHISLLQETKKRNIKFKVIHNSSVFDSIGETGLQLYKFGKITSIPKFESNSYLETVKENLSINAHTLILIDIRMDFEYALERFEKDAKNNGLVFDEIIVCSNIGTNDSKIYYKNINELKSKKIKKPFCIIVPGKLHFLEKEFLENFQ